MCWEGVCIAHPLCMGEIMKEKTIYYVHRDYNHKHDYVVVIDTTKEKASIFDRIFKRKSQWRYEDSLLQEMVEKSHL